MIEVGDWIYINTRRFRGNAFVIDRDENELLVHIPSRSVARVSINSATKFNNQLSDRDFQILIDLALDLGEKKWFKELAERRQEVMR